MMKKFLSSLLALTMILSLVIVPANAATTEGASGAITITRSPASGTIKQVDTVTFSATATVTPSGGTATAATMSDVNWSVSGTGSTGTPSGNDYVVTVGSADFTVTCTANLSVGSGADAVTVDSVSQTTDSIPVLSAQAAFEAAAKNATVSFQGRTYSFNNSTSVRIDTFNSEPLGNSLPVTVSSAYPTAVLMKDASGQWTIKDSNDGTLSLNVTVTENPINAEVAAAALTFDKASPISIREGQSVNVTAAYNRDGRQNVSYKWTRIPTTVGLNNDDRATVTFNAPDQVSSAGEAYTLTCTVKEGNSEVTHKDITINVARDPYSPDRNGESSSKTIATNSSTNYCTFKAPILYSSTAATKSIGFGDDGFKVDWAVKSGSTLINKPDQNKYTGAATVTAKSGAKSGTATVTATITYMGKQYPALEYTIDISALDAELSAITNGDNDSYRQSTLEEKLATAINKVTDTTFTSNDINKVQVAAVPSHATLKYNSSKLTAGDEVSKGLDIYADNGYIGDDSFQLKVNGTYIVTLYFKIEGDKDIKDTVTGSASGKDVTFTNSDYDYLFVYKGSASFKSSMYDGDWSKTSGHSDWTPVKKNSDYTVKSSAFDKNGKATLYVVVVDDDIASTGTITVSQKSYDIKYSVVAGESVTFSQKDFESFLEDIADDSSDYNSRKDTLELDYVKFGSLPNSTREGVLYEGKSKIDRNDKVEDLDKVTFESVAKAKDTITISFTAYGKLYKDGASKGKDVDYSGNVVISVVKEDIVFEVGVNSAIKLGSDKFIDFLRDSDKSYKKADLDYVTFDVGKNSAITSYFNGTGALYRYYNGSTGINATVSAKDEFYYNPKTSSKHYDLDDVTYVTSKFAKVGDIVYIPFTAYGTKSGQKAEGTLAIKVKQTMSFVDVRPGDYFYDSVQWAVNLDITKGTSATTFSPKQGCTRAQIVTFLWRAAKSPAPRSSTNKFTDVYATTHADYMKAIIWATEQGITTGTGNGKFSPDATCTRAQIVTFLYRFKNNPAVYGSLNFSDVNKTEHAAFYNAILWAVNNKITTGYGNGIFDPNGTCNRGDAVTFLYRALA